MSPIESINDIRLMTLMSIVMNLCEEVAMYRDNDSNHVLAEELYKSHLEITSTSEDKTITRLFKSYPLLARSIH